MGMTNIKKFVLGTIIKFKQIDWNKFKWSNLDKTKIIVLFRLFTHPIDTFNDLKYEKRGSLALANIMVTLFFIESIMDYFFVGYLFSNNEIQSFNLLTIFLKSVILIAIWSVMNWAVCTLLEGDGTFKEIWMVSCYSLLPIVIFRIPLDLISNMLTLNEGPLFHAITSFIFLWAFLLLFLGIITVHQFSVMKTFVSFLLSCGMIAIVAFLLLLSFSIFQQMSAFVKTIIREIFRR